MNYIDLSDDQLMNLANVVSHKSVTKWKIYRQSGGVTLKTKATVVYFDNDNGDVSVEIDEQDLSLCNLWEFFTLAQSLGINYSRP